MNISFKKKIGDFSFSNEDLLKVEAYQKQYKGLNLKNNKTVLIKQIEKLRVSKDSELENKVLNQIMIGRDLKNEPIAKLHQVIETTNHFYMIIEDVNCPSLRKILLKKEVLNESEVILYLKSLRQLFFKMKKHKIVHGNLRPQNIIISTNNRAKLAYFGHFDLLNAQHEVSNQLSCQSQKKISFHMFYHSPEVLLQRKFSQKSDVWALGVIIFECLFGRFPWNEQKNFQNNEKNIMGQIKNGEEKIQVSKQMKNLIFGCLQVNLDSRFDWLDVIEHQIFKKQLTAQKQQIKVKQQFQEK